MCASVLEVQSSISISFIIHEKVTLVQAINFQINLANHFIYHSLISFLGGIHNSYSSKSIIL